MSFSETLTADGQTVELHAFDDFQLHVTGPFGGGELVIWQKIGEDFEPLPGTEKKSAFSEAFRLIKLSSGNIYKFALLGSISPSIAITALGKVRYKPMP